MKIAIAGAGAMGSRFGYMLAETGNEVILIDQWADHVHAIRDNGLQVNLEGEAKVAHLPAYLPNELANNNISVELIILFTKALQLDSMLHDIQSIITKDTNVLCLLNGIGHEDTLEKYVPKENIFLGNTMWTAGMEGPGKVKLFGNGNVEMQNFLPEGKEAALKIVEVMDAAGLNTSYSDNVLYSIYKKACVNGTLNGLCTILDVNIAGFGNTTNAAFLIEAIVAEFAAVAKEEGIELNIEEVLTNIRSTFDPNGVGAHFPSMHQDLIKSNRLTEIDYINGAVVKKGEKYGIATPYCKMLTALVHCKEEILEAK